MKKGYYLLIVFAFCLFLTGCKKNVCEKKGHDYTEATCEKAKYCSVCKKEDGNPLGHTEVTDEGYEATCDKTGLTDGSHCLVCNKVLVPQEEIEALGHTEVTDEGYEATCDKAGLTDGSHCSVCNKVLVEQVEIEALGHTEVTDEGYEATCDKAGLTDGSHCSVCNKVLVEQVEIEALGHTEVTDEGYEATCDKTGLTDGSHCLICNKVIVEQEEIETLEHTWIDATCEKTKYCSVCKKEEGIALGHTEVTDEGYVATCDKTGLTDGTHCLVCNKVLVPQETVEVLGHKWDEKTEQDIDKCSVCGIDKIDLELKNVIPNETNKSITLPKTVVGYEILWESSDIDAMLNDGLIVARSDDRKIKLVANITIDNVNVKKEYEVLVKAVNVATGQYDIAFDFYASKLNKVLSKNVSLMTSEYNGCTVRYISMDESIITSKGKVTVIKVEQSTIMKIYVIKNNIAVVYNQEINVASFTPANRVNGTAKLMNEEIEKFKNGEINKLPVYNDDFETTIEWKSNVPEFIMTEDIVLTPLVKTNIILDCVITYGETSKEIEYKLENVGGNITEEEFISTLLKYMAKVELKGSKNHLKLVNDEYYLDYQQRINSYGVLNLATTNDLGVDTSYYVDETRTDFKNKFFSGKKPVPSQEVLNKIFYEGYQNPNSSNVLFVTVHESAMTLEGQNAENLAQIQYRYAFLQDDARQASWHYQVDAYSIYQSFADDIYGWHAGETNGNKYGIGIEMCVNRDGNYEGTIMNNAKLVASLMLKYNLNFDNVYRHYDHSGKECPSYLIRTGRWVEFVEMTRKEYLIRKYLVNATINYDLSIDGLNTDEVLAKYFIEGDNGLWFNKPVSEVKEIEFEINIVLNGKSYKENSIIKLLPEGSEN